jgi:antirestriction protein ArdC
LIAEIGAAFLCGHSEIADRTIDNSAAYVAQWLKRVQSEKTLVVRAAAQAQRAADFILGRTFDDGETVVGDVSPTCA